ncbi:MAG: virulence factor [bacterium]|nr:virulence factor [bacterium]
MAVYQVLCWGEIPSQVRVFEGKRPVSRQMPERFQLEIDRVAMAKGLFGTDAYLDQWEWSKKEERPGDAEEVLEALIRELEAAYDAKGRE